MYYKSLIFILSGVTKGIQRNWLSSSVFKFPFQIILHIPYFASFWFYVLDFDETTKVVIRLLSNLFLFLNEIEFDITLSVYYMGCL